MGEMLRAMDGTRMEGKRIKRISPGCMCMCMCVCVYVCTRMREECRGCRFPDGQCMM